MRDGEPANVFVATLGGPRYTSARATSGQKLEDWVKAPVCALEFVQGVPQRIVPDNARGLIVEPDRCEPRAGHTALDFAAHNGTPVLPARPLKPQHEAKVTH